jgi:hypothetical protein
VAAGTLVTAIGIAAVGLAGVAAVSLAFYFVGRSEDRDRERAASERQPGTARRGLGRRLVRRRGARD